MPKQTINSSDILRTTSLNKINGNFDELYSDKADSSTTLSGYGITDAYTETETDALLDDKLDNIGVSSKDCVGLWDGQNLDLANSKILDSSPNTNNDGTLSGYTLNNGTVVGGVSIEGEMIKGNGTDARVDCGDILSNKDEFSIYCEGIINSIDASQTILGSNGTGGDGISLYYSFGSNALSFQVRNSNSTYQTTNSSVSPVVGQKYKIFFTFKRNDFIKGYVDGVEVASFATGDFPTTTGQIFRLLARRTSERGNTSVNNVRVWDTVLAEAERTAELNSEYAVKGENLIAQYSGRDYSGTSSTPTTILDSNPIVQGHNEFTRALRFDGVDDRITIPFVMPTGDFSTISIVKANSLIDKAGIWSRRGNSKNNSFLRLTGTLGKIQFYRQTGTSTIYEINESVDSVIDTDNYYTIITRYDDKLGISSIFVNGIEININTTTSSHSLSGTDYIIGKDSTINFNGNITNGIIDRALSDEEIKNIYNRTKPLFTDNNPQGSNIGFGVKGGLTVDKIKALNLPTSSTGLEVGELYNDSGTIKIKL